MKKYFIAISVLMSVACVQADAQAFLNKMKEKAQSAVGDKLSEKMQGTRMGALMDKAKQTAATEETAAARYGDEVEDAREGNSEVNALKDRTQLSRKSISMCSWDDTQVTPSESKFPVPLMNELPAVPTAEELVSPDEARQKAYYMAIKRVTMRAEQLQNDETCDKEQEDMWKKKMRETMKKSYGLTDEEIDLIDSGNMTEEQEQRLGEKITMAMLGVDMNGLQNMQNMASKYENMTEAQREAESAKMAESMMGNLLSGQMAVIDKHKSDIPKHLGIQADELKESVRMASTAMAQGQGKPNPAMEKAMEKKDQELKARTEAYRKTLSPDDRKKSVDFEKQFQKEMEEVSKNAYMAANPMGAMLANIGQNQKENDLVKMQKAMLEYTEAINKAIPQEMFDAHKDAAFSDAERKKVEAIKAKIMATDDPAVYNPLHLEALAIINSYRQRAAKAWRADVEKRVNAIKQSLPQIIKVNRKAIEDGIIPECMLWRTPLNMVVEAGDILCDAYSEFPSEYPVMYKEETVRQVKLDPEEVMWWPEFYVTNTLENILAGKTIFKAKSDSRVYQFNAGKWVRVDNIKIDDRKLDGTEKPKAGKWTSQDGKRTVSYVADGGYFLLPEGDEIHPQAIERIGNNVVWAEIRTVDTKEGTVIQVVKCTYKL